MLAYNLHRKLSTSVFWKPSWNHGHQILRCTLMVMFKMNHHCFWNCCSMKAIWISSNFQTARFIQHARLECCMRGRVVCVSPPARRKLDTSLHHEVNWLAIHPTPQLIGQSIDVCDYSIDHEYGAWSFHAIFPVRMPTLHNGKSQDTFLFRLRLNTIVKASKRHWFEAWNAAVDHAPKKHLLPMTFW